MSGLPVSNSKGTLLISRLNEPERNGEWALILVIVKLTGTEPATRLELLVLGSAVAGR